MYYAFRIDKRTCADRRERNDGQTCKRSCPERWPNCICQSTEPYRSCFPLAGLFSAIRLSNLGIAWGVVRLLEGSGETGWGPSFSLTEASGVGTRSWTLTLSERTRASYRSRGTRVQRWAIAGGCCVR
jgi:hypothetical protein